MYKTIRIYLDPLVASMNICIQCIHISILGDQGTHVFYTCIQYTFVCM